MPQRSFARAQTAAQLDTRQAWQHPIQDDEVWRVLIDGNLDLIAASCDRHAKAFRFQIILEQHRQRLFVLDDHNLGIHRLAPHLPWTCRCYPLPIPACDKTSVRLVQSDFGRSSPRTLPFIQVVDRFRNIRRVIADPLKVFSAE